MAKVQKPSIFNRRRFLKRGALFIPATWGIRRALAQSLNLADGPFISPSGSSLSAQAIADGNAWAAQVITNGGAAVSNNSLAASKVFAQAMIDCGLRSTVIAANFFAPDNLIAALTPFYAFSGSNPWSNLGSPTFVLGDLTTAGLKGNGTSKYLKPNILGTTISSDNSAAIAIYVSVLGSAQNYDFGYTNDAASDACAIKIHSAANFVGYTWAASSVVSTARTGGAGYYCLTRTASNALQAFYASSGSAHAQIGSTSAGASGSRGAHDMFIYTADHWNSGNPIDLGFSDNTYSFFGIFNSVSAANSPNLFNALQALRTSLGGGFV